MPKEKDGDEGKTFTQADVDRMIQDRLERDRRSRADEAATQVTELQQQLDTVTGERDTARSELTTLTEAKTTAEGAATLAERRAAVAIAAAKAGATDPNDVLAFVDDAAFTGDEFDAGKLAEGVLDSKPYLKGGTGGGGLGPGAGGDGPPDPSQMDMDTYMTHRAQQRTPQ